MSKKPQIGDMYMVTEIVSGSVTSMERLESDPAIEIVRVEQGGAVKYFSREEYEGRKNGTWQVYDMMGNPLPIGTITLVHEEEKNPP